jgi:hypothetical protein
VQLSDFYDQQVNRVDLAAELLIAKAYEADDNHQFEATIDSQRAQLIDELRNYEALHINDLRKQSLDSQQQEGNLVLSKEELFSAEFCFMIDMKSKQPYDIGLRLFVVDTYLNQDQIACFQELINFMSVETTGAEKRFPSLLFKRVII